MIALLTILWSIVIIKAIFFWLYLWQLKEYHLKRFIDHFRTEKGKRIIFNPLQLFKIALLPALYFNQLLWLLAFSYGIEFIFFAVKVAKKSVKKPVFTAKAVGLLVIALALFGGFIFILQKTAKPLFWLVLADILSPFLISGIVLALQPMTVLARSRILDMAKVKRAGLKNLKVIGITGSYGKTSTKEILKIILEQKFKVLTTKEHQNSEIGISHCILDELKPEHQVFICEMGAYDKGKIRQVANIVQPRIGVVTGVNEQHLALFGSMENLMSAEGGIELTNALPENGVLILNEDSALIQNAKRWDKYQNDNVKIKIKLCSAKQKTDLWAENIVVEKDWLYFKVCDKAGGSADFKINLVGRHNIENVLLAAAVAKELGMSLSEITAACKKIKPGQGAMKLFRKEGSADIIDSTYSANPDGVITSLEHLKFWPGKKIIIMPCLIELGPAAKEVHEKIGRKIGQVCDFAVITTKDWFEEIRKTAVVGGMKPENIIFSESSKEILEKIKSYCQPESIILLEGRLPQKLKELLKI